MKALSAWLILIALPAAAADTPALFDAIRAGDTAYIKAHLTKPELEARDRRGSTPLMHAAAFGDLNNSFNDIVKLVLVVDRRFPPFIEVPGAFRRLLTPAIFSG